jgi:hypothetical protein
MAGRLRGSFAAAGRAEIAGLTGPSVVVDTTSSPTWIVGSEPTPTGLAIGVEAGRSYLAVSEAALLHPEVRPGVGKRLRKPDSAAAWMLIAPREFLEAAQPLVELRRRQGLTATAVAVEDVFAEFGFGESNPVAIRDFIAYAFHEGRIPPRYVLLLGDSTYDPKNYLATDVGDRIPSAIVKTSYLWTASDPTLAAVNGTDLVPDVAIGRLSARSVDEAQVLVSKLVAFEESGRGLAGAAVLVADNADAGGQFESDADDVARLLSPQRDIQKIYLRDQGLAGARAQVRAAFDAGAGIVSYVGHGGTAVWASENIFNSFDVATLQPQAAEPLLLTLDCLNGFFHFPPLDSLAEALVKAEGKGAIAAVAPSGLSLDAAAHVYHKALVQQIESGENRRLGDAMLSAQRAYADSGALPELLSIYHLFGDPGMRLP